MPVASLNHPNICTLHDFGPVMLTSDGVKVLDFGLAKSSSQPGPTDETRTKLLSTVLAVAHLPPGVAR